MNLKSIQRHAKQRMRDEGDDHETIIDADLLLKLIDIAICANAVINKSPDWRSAEINERDLGDAIDRAGIVAWP